MALHGEVARLKPDPGALTRYYLFIAAGGALGAVFVAVFAPLYFSGDYELPLALAACAVFVVVALLADPDGYFYRARRWLPSLAVIALVGAFAVSIGMRIDAMGEGTRLMLRNFYGTLRIVDRDNNPLRARRELLNGSIDHGIQLLAPARHMLPTTYYSTRSGIGLAIRSLEALRPSLRVGVVGLGAGTIAAYGRPGDRYIFYEINPLVVAMAEHQFTFLRDSPATLAIVNGDARLSLESEPPQAFDVLAVDAFSGDAIPVHMLTREAFEQYFRHLRPTGLLAVHVSNRFINLRPVVARAAEALHKSAVLVSNPEDEAESISNATWILLTSDAPQLTTGLIGQHATRLEAAPDVRLWTDDYSDPLRALNF